MSKYWSQSSHCSPWLTEAVSVPRLWVSHPGPVTTWESRVRDRVSPGHNNNTHLHTSYPSYPSTDRAVHTATNLNINTMMSVTSEMSSAEWTPEKILGTTSSKSIMLSKIIDVFTGTYFELLSGCSLHTPQSLMSRPGPWQSNGHSVQRRNIK